MPGDPASKDTFHVEARELSELAVVKGHPNNPKPLNLYIVEIWSLNGLYRVYIYIEIV